MTDLYNESYPPSILAPQQPGQYVGQWLLSANDPPPAGEANLGSGAVAINAVDAGSTDQSVLLGSLADGDSIGFVGPNGWIEYLVSSVVLTSGVYEIVASIAHQTGSPPADGELAAVAITHPTRGGGTPPPPPPPVGVPTTIDTGFDPSAWTVAEVQEYIDNIADSGANEDDPDVIAETQRVLEAEVAGLDRSTLVTWLDHRYGVVHP